MIMVKFSKDDSANETLSKLFEILLFVLLFFQLGETCCFSTLPFVHIASKRQRQ